MPLPFSEIRTKINTLGAKTTKSSVFPVNVSEIDGDILDHLIESNDRLLSIEEFSAMSMENVNLPVQSDLYFNFRNVNVGDVLPSLTPEIPSEDGFYLAIRSFNTDSHRILRLTAKGNDMVRAYCALDADLKVLAIASSSERVFDNSYVGLPAGTRHVICSSYDVPLVAVVMGNPVDSVDEGDSYSRSLEIKRMMNVVYDYGTSDIGNLFVDSRIAYNASCPNAQVVIIDWLPSYKLTVNMNSGTPQVWGVAFLDADSFIIGRVEPFRSALRNRTIVPPDGTARVVLQTYDSELFPMEINVTYNLLDKIVDDYEAGNINSGSGSGNTTSDNSLVSYSPSLKGKTVVVFGDSITEFKDEAGCSIADYIAKYSGANVYNLSVGGSRVTTRCAPPSIGDGIAWSKERAEAVFDIMNFVTSIFEESKSVITQEYIDSIVKPASDFLRSYSADHSFAVSELQSLYDDILSKYDWPLDYIDFFVFSGGVNDARSGVYGGDLKDGAVLDNVQGNDCLAAGFSNIFKNIDSSKIYWIFPEYFWWNVDGTPDDMEFDNDPDNAYTYDSWFTYAWGNSSEFLGTNLYKVFKNLPFDCKFRSFMSQHDDRMKYIGGKVYRFEKNDGIHPYKAFRNIARGLVRMFSNNAKFPM